MPRIVLWAITGAIVGMVVTYAVQRLRGR